MCIDSNIISGLISGIIGMAGALIGAAIGYKGSISATNKNIREQQIFGERMLILQLKHSVEMINVWKEQIYNTKENISIPYNQNAIIYDNEWYKYVATTNQLSLEEKENLIVWFTWFIQIGYLSAFAGGYLDKKQLEKLISKEATNLEDVNTIIEKLQKCSHEKHSG